MMYFKQLAPFFMLLIAFSLVEGGLNADYAEARSKFGGRSFKMSPKKSPVKSTQGVKKQNSGGFGRGLAGGLLGGALGGMLFGSMFGAGGSGMGILPLLLLAGGAYFFFRKMKKPTQSNYSANNQNAGQQGPGLFGGGGTASSPPIAEFEDPLEEGLSQIRETDRKFDADDFVEIASDVFFKIQAGWMRRDLDSYRHLLGDQLAREYEGHFAEMHQNGHINKLESIAVRNIKIIAAGSDGVEDFLTVLFTANLLDYTVDDQTDELVEGSMTDPVKFEEKWTWARPVGTQNWKLEGIEN